MLNKLEVRIGQVVWGGCCHFPHYILKCEVMSTLFTGHCPHPTSHFSSYLDVYIIKLLYIYIYIYIYLIYLII